MRVKLLRLLLIVAWVTGAALIVSDGRINTAQAQSNVREIQMLAVEFKGTFGKEESQPEGTQVNAYRWDPGTIVARKGDALKFVIYGINGGKGHPSYIVGPDGQAVTLQVEPATKAVSVGNIAGFDVRRGETTTVTFTVDKAGVYKILCTLHLPSMVVDIVVLD
jgi:plastocyanin